MSQDSITNDDIIEVGADDDVVKVADDAPAWEGVFADSWGDGKDGDDGDGGGFADRNLTDPEPPLPEALDTLVDTLLGEEDDDGNVPSDASADDGQDDERDDWRDGLPDEADLWDDDAVVPYMRDDDDGEVLVTMSQEATIISDMPPVSRSPRKEGGKATPPQRPRHDEARSGVSLGAMLACLLMGIAIGVLVTFIVTSGVAQGGSGSDKDGKALTTGSVDASSLDAEMVRYEYDGNKVSLSVKDVIELTGSMDSMKDEATGRYSVPSAEKAIEAVRNDIVRKDADTHGIEVTDGDVSDYVSDTYGVATVEELTKQVGLSKEETERQLRDRLVIKFLKQDVVGDKELLPLVEPATPDDGDPDVLTEEYANYIVNLAGDEWDSDANKWRNESSAFAKAFEEEPFDGGIASYNMARRAYDVVRQRNEEIQRTIDGAWSDYINDMFRKTTVTLSVASR